MTTETLRTDTAQAATPRPGGLLLAGDPGYDAVRTPWNVTVDQRPAAVAHPADAAEVAALVRQAAAGRLRIAAQGTGHGAAALGPLDDVVLLRTARMNGVSIDARARRARVGAGARWLDVVEPAGAAGLAALHGSSPDVGIAGYSLGGGMGWYARRLGLQANSVTAVELVTADGALVRADAEHEPDLFWALRGGGGSFGVVTALEFALYPIPTAYAGLLAWDWRHAERVLTRWADWAPTAPDAVTTSLRLLQVPPIPEIPEPLRGRQLVVIDGAVLADNPDAERILAPLRELGPELDTFTRLPAPALVRLHMDPEGPTPVVSGSRMLAALPPAAIGAILDTAGPDSGTSLPVPAELRQLGGALGRPAPGAGALSMVDGAFLLFTCGIAASPETAAHGLADTRRVTDALAPFASGREYLNFVDQPADAATGYDPATWARLRAIRASVDPDGLFVANHPVPPAA
ncbi:Mitomycin radical oxidase [Frankia canadensis]|uniref:Mitomycin radical oxidase n=1 Tax=Frankia canadensis TaxID=1836972 RepID=A0A2I2KM64_9ACTN|nr:FAD-binding oxidoreductase [Frankia canadensis]SNQ46754.1 Mitomycin radical oxidase [Frankia canadensis]SOU54044.1 Mitomycin radical oxidase [Frankia canadensis]